ncbi:MULTISPECIES: hypothetical protein [unclassified Bradyrhizobium]|uniref:hypothetical protein n=1 Tax=unclassified Bradyrhizobium TaxID=2631580 RepID=UPI0028EAE56D|nr:MULTISPECIES: hypothetical protein [unclassified Bradyrhizobium]
MNSPDNKKRETLSRLVDELVEDLFATPDQELLSEFTDVPGGAAKNAEEMRALFGGSVLKANKERLKAAKAGAAASRTSRSAAPLSDLTDIRQRFRRTLAACPPEVKLTLAARNENELSDADMLGMLQDLEELGIFGPEDRDGKSS